MTPYYETNLGELLQTDCRSIPFPDNHFTTVITDPPYELGFMGKKWDSSGVAFQVETWVEILRICKPGAMLMAFGGTRTSHRLVCAIEDAGWEIRDSMMWLYGSGFPKSYNISKGIDKTGGESLSWFIDYVLQVAKENGIKKKEITALLPSRTGGMTGWLYNKASGAQSLTVDQYNILKDCLNLPFDTIQEAKREIVGKDRSGLTNWFAKGGEFDITLSATESAKIWDGYGTALKPAYEPIVIAMKPTDGTFANNALVHGVAGLNIDAGRVGTEIRTTKGMSKKQPEGAGTFRDDNWIPKDIETISKGRWPANIILDEEAGAMLDEQSGVGKTNQGMRGIGFNNSTVFGNGDTGFDTLRGFNDTGGASRFFYTAKASRSERGKDNDHPTVKPVALIRYLVELTAPPKDALILDPFIGSGTLGVVCEKLGIKYVGIDLDCSIAAKRIERETSQQRLPGGF